MDLEALAWRNARAGADASPDPYAKASRMKQNGENFLLDGMAAIPGLRGMMLTFDDSSTGMKQFGARIQPLLRCRAHTLAAA